jgi:hypothetical protein
MSVSALRPLLAAPACSLVALLMIAPNVAADLTIDAKQGSAYDIYTHGSSSLSAPQNTTIASLWGGYIVDWQAPSGMAMQQVTGYTVYRVPGPSTGGGIQTFHLPARSTAVYDRPGDGTYIYLVTATFAGASVMESVPGYPLTTRDTNYPHCHVVGIYYSAPYYDTGIDCLFPLP